MIVSIPNMVKHMILQSVVLLLLGTFLSFYDTGNSINDNYVYGMETDRFSSYIGRIEEHPSTHFIDMPLDITVLEEKKKSNRSDTEILNSTENYKLISNSTRKQEEFKKGFCGTNSTSTGFSEYITEYTLPQNCEMPLGIATDSEDNEVWYVSTKRGILGKYDIDKHEFEQHIIPQWKVREDPSGFSQVWDVKIDDENDADRPNDIWFTDTAQNAIWRFKKSTEQFEMYKIPVQSESFGTTYPITIDVVANKSDKEGTNDKSVFFIGTFLSSLWFAEIDKLKNGTIDGMHQIQVPIEYGFSNIDPFYVTSGSFVFDEDRNSAWITMLSYSRKGQIFEYDLDNKSFNVFVLPDDHSSPLGIVIGDGGGDDDDDDTADNQDDKIDLWITNPGTSMFYNYEITEQELMDSDENMQTIAEQDTKKMSNKVNIERYTTSMASPRIFGRQFYDNNNSNETEADADPRNGYYTLPSWMKKARDGSIWFNQQQGNKISHFDPDEQLLVEYWIPSQNKEWGSCDSEEMEDEKSIDRNHNSSGGCGIANALNFALKESNQKEDDGDEENPVEEIWFTEWSTNKIGRIDAEKDLPFDINIDESDQDLTIKRGEPEKIKMTLTINKERIDHENLTSEDDATREYTGTESSKLPDPTGYHGELITMTAAGTFTSTGYLGNSTGYFDVPILTLNQNENNDGDDEYENEQEISFVFTPSKDTVPGDYTLILGAEDRSVSVLKAVKINVI
jgi:virginiamycin B lyase